MTTPGGVPNLPQGALTIDTLASKTQDMTTPAMRSRAAERFPNIFDSSTGGNALNDLTPIGIITQIFSGFNSVVANADPADVQGPEDLPGMLLDFIESLPVVGELIGLLEAILGTYAGDDPVLLQVQTIFAPIRAIVDALTAVAGGTGGLGNFFPDLLGLLGNPTGLGTGSVDVTGWASSFINDILNPTGLLATITQFWDLLNGLATGTTTSGGATLPLTLPFTFGGGAASPIEFFFQNLTAFLPLGLTGAGFNPATAAEQFIQTVLNPTGILATGSGVNDAIAQALQLVPWSADIVTYINNALGGLFGGVDFSNPLDTNAVWANVIENIFNPLGLMEAVLPASIMGNLEALFGGVDLTSGGLSVGSVWTQLIDNVVNPLGLLAQLDGQTGTLLNSQSPVLLTDLIGAVFGGLNNNSALPALPFSDIIAAIQNSLQFIPSGNVTSGEIGAPNIGAALSAVLNNFVGGFVGQAGTGATTADAFNISNLISSWASQGRDAFGIQGIRTNRSLDTGLLATSQSNIALSKVALQSSAPTFGVTQAATTIAWDVIKESQPIGVIRWYGSGNASLTAFYVNMWKMDRATGDTTLVHRSANILGDIPATVSPPPVISYTLPAANVIAALASECYGFELEPKGAGTHNAVGSPTWLADDPSAFPKRLAGTRNAGSGTPPATIATGSVAYAGNVPFIEYGIEAGIGTDYHNPVSTPFTLVGTTTTPIPSWANFVDIIEVPGGGGGHQGGTWGIGGAGGDNGLWASTTWARGVDWAATETPVLSITVGAGGSAGVGGNGGNGGASTVVLPATTGHAAQTLTTAGGAGATSFDVAGSQHAGQSPGDALYNAVPYVGGAAQNTYGADGVAPGGGGAGGNWVSFQPGGKGARGQVWIVARQT